MHFQAPLSEEQEERRREGLRTLARIIAQHYLEHPERYAAGSEAGKITTHLRGRRASTSELGHTSKGEDEK